MSNVPRVRLVQDLLEGLDGTTVLWELVRRNLRESFRFARLLEEYDNAEITGYSSFVSFLESGGFINAENPSRAELLLLSVYVKFFSLCNALNEYDSSDG